MSHGQRCISCKPSEALTTGLLGEVVFGLKLLKNGLFGTAVAIGNK